MTKKSKQMWNKIGSPPPAGLKNDELKCLSLNNIVIAAARTGNDNNNKNTVTNKLHTNKGIICIRKPGTRIFLIVTIK